MIQSELKNLIAAKSVQNREVGTAIRFQPGQDPMVLCPVQVTNLTREAGSGFWTGLEPSRTVHPVPPLTAGRIPSPVADTSWWQRPTTWPARFDLGTSDVTRSEGDDGGNAHADADGEDEASQADHGSMQNVEDRWYGRFDPWTSGGEGYGCEDGDEADTDEEEEA